MRDLTGHTKHRAQLMNRSLQERYLGQGSILSPAVIGHQGPGPGKSGRAIAWVYLAGPPMICSYL